MYKKLNPWSSPDQQTQCSTAVAQVQFLVGELRSQQSGGAQKTKQNQNSELSTAFFSDALLLDSERGKIIFIIDLGQFDRSAS